MVKWGFHDNKEHALDVCITCPGAVAWIALDRLRNGGIPTNRLNYSITNPRNLNIMGGMGTGINEPYGRKNTAMPITSCKSR